MTKWSDYTAARDSMFRHSHTDHAPWTVVRANDKRRSRIAVLRHVLCSIDYEGRDMEAIGEADPLIIADDPALLSA